MCTPTNIKNRLAILFGYAAGARVGSVSAICLQNSHRAHGLPTNVQFVVFLFFFNKQF